LNEVTEPPREDDAPELETLLDAALPSCDPAAASPSTAAVLR
jgi:hypothetical protein